MAKLGTSGREFADMISKDHLAPYSNPGSKLPGADKNGVRAEFNLADRQIRFTFVTTMNERIDFVLNIQAFEQDPARTIFDMHQAIKGGLEVYKHEKQEKESIIISPYDTGDLAKAVRNILH